MARCLYAVALMTLLTGAAMLSVSLTQAATPAEYMAPVCAHVAERVFTPPGPKARLPDDVVLRTISTTTDRAALRAALGHGDPNAQRGKHGATALTHAVGVGNWSAVQELLAVGADVNQAGRQGETAFELAISLTRSDLACQLVSHGATVPSPTQPFLYLLPASALTQRDADAVAFARLFLEAGYPVDARLPPADQTALHVAAETGKVELAKYLLSRRANTSLRDAQGRTPSDVAEANGHSAIVKLFASGKGR